MAKISTFKAVDSLFESQVFCCLDFVEVFFVISWWQISYKRRSDSDLDMPIQQKRKKQKVVHAIASNC